MRRSGYSLLVAGLIVVMAAPGALATTAADLVLTSASANVGSATSGTRVIFRASAKNLGPGTSQLDVTYLNAVNFAPKREVCIVPPSESGDINTPSPDTPSCEFANVPEGDRVGVKVAGVVSGDPGAAASIAFCTSNETSEGDGNPDNDCKAAVIKIVAG
jgi:hypothetical protein